MGSLGEFEGDFSPISNSQPHQAVNNRVGYKDGDDDIGQVRDKIIVQYVSHLLTPSSHSGGIWLAACVLMFVTYLKTPRVKIIDFCKMIVHYRTHD